MFQREYEYLYEAKAEVNKTTATFSCSDILRYQWRTHSLMYCFKYQTVAANNAVTDHKQFCLPSNNSIGELSAYFNQVFTL